MPSGTTFRGRCAASAPRPDDCWRRPCAAAPPPRGITMSIPDGIAWLERLQSLSRLSFTHDGKALLVTVGAASVERGQPHDSHIWRFELDGRKTQLTRGPHAEGFAVASPVD